MGLRFKKSIKIAPGIKFNIGKKSLGLSVGGKYGGVSFNSKRGLSGRTSMPGTGLSYQWNVGGKKSRQNSGVSNSAIKLITLNAKTYLLLTLLLGYLGIHRFYRRQYLIGFIYLISFGCFGIGWIYDSVVAARLYIEIKKESNKQ